MAEHLDQRSTLVRRLQGSLSSSSAAAAKRLAPSSRATETKSYSRGDARAATISAGSQSS